MPKFFVDASRNALVYAGIKMETGRWMMFSLLNSLLMGVVIALIIRTFLGEGGLIFIGGTAMVFGIAFVGIFHNVLIYYGGRRARQIEVMLPDALQLIAANIRADIPIHKALLLAARPEFGLLAGELDVLGNSILTGKPTSMAFKEFGERVNSPLVTRIATLMEEGLRSGHNVAGMMDQIAYDIRAFKILDDEANANIGSYVLFIVMAVLIVAPVLYSISISFIDLTSQVKETLDVGSLVQEAAIGGNSPLIGLVAGESGINVDTLIWFSALNLATSSGIAAILVSVLQTGETMQKMPYILMFILVAETLFFVSITVLRIVLGGFFT
ncbi:MAG: type II secretion system F family protein [Candidatus Diapherotrites archaeon]|nr:type II secretion system F family protein [Candidatus Diapherotrites archaeon]